MSDDLNLVLIAWYFRRVLGVSGRRRQVETSKYDKINSAIFLIKFISLGITFLIRFCRAINLLPPSDHHPSATCWSNLGYMTPPLNDYVW